ncbi:restart primosome assembly protein PriC [Psychromonas ingrahamii 37]|uniref:Restart primosome assembly protein PriC n=1 Tax=Psychromonas ingrahamii (strain DSM 17664 / CCUG 51855 / 37) TaxID=357804 RepID=A1SWQ6_PSYIN|nr:primosomal replication protein [Psychromonas ingrahamii]ABM03921.1 restart primosome assembly protein PriC [Psychromonas ingrahamii 37]
MVQLSSKNLPIDQLNRQLKVLSKRCEVLDESVSQTENKCFVFEVHIFPKRCLTLLGYIKQIEHTAKSLQNALDKNLPEALIAFECTLFIDQFQVLLQLVQSLEKGEADILYKSYSSIKENIYQQLQKQYHYEERLLNMIAEQEELMTHSNAQQKIDIKEKIEVLKGRYQKCNSYTQMLEFKFQDSSDE